LFANDAKYNVELNNLVMDPKNNQQSKSQIKGYTIQRSIPSVRAQTIPTVRLMATVKSPSKIRFIGWL
jgi:hypothetical protein